MGLDKQTDKDMKKYKYINEIKTFIGDSTYYDTNGGGYIWGKKNKDLQMLAQVEDPIKQSNDAPLISVRGWGAIQHLFKNYEEAIEFQNELGEFIADAINEKLFKTTSS